MRIKAILFLVIFFQLILFSCKKQEVEKTGSDFKVFNFSTDKCSTTTDGAFLLTGSSFITKVDVNGNILWTKDRYTTDYARSLNSGEYISCIRAGNHLIMDKLDASGNTVTTKNLYMSDSATSIENPKVVELASGDLLFFGTKSFDSLLLIIKTTNGGIPYWNKSIKLDINLSVINKVIEGNTAGEIVLIGNSSKINFAVKMAFVKINSNDGSLIWEKQKTFGQWESYPINIHKLNNSQYTVTGYYDISQTEYFNYQFSAFIMDESGNTISSYNTGGSKQDYCLSSLVDPSTGDITMIGMEGRGKNSRDLNLSNIKIFTINSSLTSVISDKTYADLQACSALNAIKNADGSLSVIGIKYAFDNSNIVQTFFMKIKPDGTL